MAIWPKFRKFARLKVYTDVKRLILAIIACVAAMCLTAQTASYFPYPVPPESLPLGRARANYMVEHFWDHCHWKTAYSAPAKMQGALEDFANILPLAAPDTIRLSTAKLIKESQKKPADFATLMRMAESTFNSDSASLFSDEVYLPFAEAASSFKKFTADERAKYALQAQRIRSTAEGATLPALKAHGRNGQPVMLNDTTCGAATYVILLEEPADRDARFTRLQLTANVAARRLVDAGLLKPLLVYTGKADGDWWKGTENLPEQWTVVEMPDAGEYFDLRMRPSLYMLDSDMTVVSKWMPMSALIANCEQLIRMIDSQR